MKSQVWKNAVIGLLVVLNIAVLTTLWLQQRSASSKSDTGDTRLLPPGPEHLPPPPGMDRTIIDILELDRDQQETFRKLKQEHRWRAGQLEEEIRKLKGELLETVPEGNATAADSLAALIGEKQTEMEKALYRHFADLREICREDQLDRMDDLMVRAGRRILPPPPPR